MPLSGINTAPLSQAAASATYLPVLTPTSKTTTYTATAADLVLADATSAAFTVTLPAATANAYVGVKKTDSSTNIVTVSPASGTIDGATSLQVTHQNTVVVLRADGTNWSVVHGYRAKAALDVAYRSLPGAYSTMATPIYAWHRGGGNIGPENTLEAFRAAAAMGMATLETDCHVLKGGGLGIMHDDTVDRTTSSTGNVADLTVTEWVQLAADANSWFLSTGRYAGNMTVPTVDDVIREFAGRTLIIIEAKDAATAQPLADRIVAQGLKTSTIVEAQTGSWLAPAVAAGIPAAIVDANASASAATLLGYGASWVFVQNGGALTSAIAPYLAAGLKVGVYGVVRHIDRDTWLAAGATMIISDDPAYIQFAPGSAAAASTKDPFTSKTFGHGMLSSNGGIRGVSVGTDRWGFGAAATFTNQYVTLGWNYISGDPTAYTQTLKITYDNSVANGQANYAFGMVNDGIFDVSTKVNGYHVRLTVDGTLKLFKDDSGAGTSTQLGSTLNTLTSGSLAAGETRTITITVTATQITVTLTAATGANTTGVGSSVGPVTDSTYRGRYSHIGRGGANTQQVSFSAFSRT